MSACAWASSIVVAAPVNVLNRAAVSLEEASLDRWSTGVRMIRGSPTGIELDFGIVGRATRSRIAWRLGPAVRDARRPPSGGRNTVELLEAESPEACCNEVEEV